MLCSAYMICRCRAAWEDQEGTEEMEAMDIDKELDREEGEDEDDAGGADESAQIMPTEEQAAFHRRPSR